MYTTIIGGIIAMLFGFFIGLLIYIVNHHAYKIQKENEKRNFNKEVENSNNDILSSVDLDGNVSHNKIEKGNFETCNSVCSSGCAGNCYGTCRAKCIGCDGSCSGGCGGCTGCTGCSGTNIAAINPFIKEVESKSCC